MTAKTHILGGLLAGELLALATDVSAPRDIALLMAGAAAGALVPDIDHVNSKISRSSVASQITSYAVAAVTHHRGFIHTPLFVAACTAALTAASFLGLPYGRLLTMALAAGMLSHLLLDTLNPGGIMWLWPVSKRRISLAPIRTRSAGELLVMAALLLLVLWLGGRYLSALPAAFHRLLPRLPEIFTLP